MARLAITKDVLSTFAKLDKTVQGAVEAAIARFADGTPMAYLEKYPAASTTGSVCSVWTMSLVRGRTGPGQRGDTYCLLTILPIDEAVGYATSHRVSVNQATGVLEVSNSAAIQADAAVPADGGWQPERHAAVR